MKSPWFSNQNRTKPPDAPAATLESRSALLTINDGACTMMLLFSETRSESTAFFRHGRQNGPFVVWGVSVGVVVFILVVAALVAAVWWNKVHARNALRGCEFAVPMSPEGVSAALAERYCSGGARNALRSTFSGVKVQRAGALRFEYVTKVGDHGTVTIRPQASGAVVSASADKLFVGTPVKMRPKSGVFALSAAMTSGIYKILGITPGAAKVCAFHKRLERSLGKTAQAALPRAA